MYSTVLRVLLAEDNPNDVRGFESALARRADRATFELNVLHDGISVLEFLRKSGEFTAAERPDLLVLNLNMPRMQGWEVLRHMKEDPALRKIPVVIWTISERSEDIDLSFELGAQGYFVKPVDAADMETQLNAILTCFRWAYLNPCARH